MRKAISFLKKQQMKGIWCPNLNPARAGIADTGRQSSNHQPSRLIYEESEWNVR